ncbi:MAG: hypothetical protein Edafosvirus40_1, partial [Edafosvirus sp.]
MEENMTQIDEKNIREIIRNNHLNKHYKSDELPTLVDTIIDQVKTKFNKNINRDLMCTFLFNYLCYSEKLLTYSMSPIKRKKKMNNDMSIFMNKKDNIKVSPKKETGKKNSVNEKPNDKPKEKL